MQWWPGFPWDTPEPRRALGLSKISAEPLMLRLRFCFVDSKSGPLERVHSCICCPPHETWPPDLARSSDVNTCITEPTVNVIDPQMSSGNRSVREHITVGSKTADYDNSR